MDPNTDEIDVEVFPIIRIYKSGRIERLIGTDVVPASFDPSTGVSSKDVLIDPSTGVSARLYLPENLSGDDKKKKIPILVYYHGGGFCIETAASPTYHNYLNTLVSQSNLLAISVDYRRAPEHRLPAAYDDSWRALLWVASQSDPWLADHGDYDRLFLAGDSAGANIAHNMAIASISAPSEAINLRIKGILLVHPYFETNESRLRHPTSDFWKILLPDQGMSPDDPRLNPFVDGAPSMAALLCERVMVCIGEEDFIKDRGVAYCEELKKSGYKGEVEVLESEGEGHVFHLQKPECEKAKQKMERVVAFFNH